MQDPSKKVKVEKLEYFFVSCLITFAFSSSEHSKNRRGKNCILSRRIRWQIRWLWFYLYFECGIKQTCGAQTAEQWLRLPRDQTNCNSDSFQTFPFLPIQKEKASPLNSCNHGLHYSFILYHLWMFHIFDISPSKEPVSAMKLFSLRR